MKSISYFVVGLLLSFGLLVEAQENLNNFIENQEASTSSDGYDTFIEFREGIDKNQEDLTQDQEDLTQDPFISNFLEGAQETGRPNIINEEITGVLGEDGKLKVSFVVENNSNFPTEEIYYSVYPGFRISGGGTMTHPLLDGVVRSQGFLLLPGEKKEIVSEVNFPEKFKEYQKAAIEIKIENTRGIGLVTRTLLISANNGNRSTLRNLDYLAPARLEMFVNDKLVNLQYGPTVFLTEDTYRIKATLPKQKEVLKLKPKFEYFEDSYISRPLRVVNLGPIITSEDEDVEFFIDVRLDKLKPGIYPVKLSFDSDKNGVIINHTVGRFIIGGERGEIVYMNPIIDSGLLKKIDLLLHGAAPDIINDARERSRLAKVEISIIDHKNNVVHEEYQDIQLLPITQSKIKLIKPLDVLEISKITVTLFGEKGGVLDVFEYVFDKENDPETSWFGLISILFIFILLLIFTMKKKFSNKTLVFLVFLMTSILHSDVYAAPVNSDLLVNFYGEGGPYHNPDFEVLYNLTTAGYVNLTVNEPQSPPTCYAPGSLIPVDISVAYSLCGNIPIADCDEADAENCDAQDVLEFTVYGFEDWFFPMPERFQNDGSGDVDLTDAWWTNLYNNVPREHNPTSSIEVFDSEINTEGGGGSYKAQIHAPALPGVYKLYMKLEAKHKKGWSQWSGSVDVEICGQTDACLYMPGIQTVDSNGVLRDEDNSVLEGYEVKFLSTGSDNRDYSGSNVSKLSQYFDENGFMTESDPYKLRTVCNYCGAVPFIDDKVDPYYDNDYEAQRSDFPTKAVYDNTWLNRYIADIGNADWTNWYLNHPDNDQYWNFDDKHGLGLLEDYLSHGYLDNVYGAGRVGFDDFHFAVIGGYDSSLANYEQTYLASRAYGSYPDLSEFKFDNVYFPKQAPFMEFSVGGVVFHRKSAGTEPGKDIFTATFPRYIEEANRSNGDPVYISGLSIPYYGNNRTIYNNINQPVTPPPPLVLTGTMPDLLNQIIALPDRYDDLNHSGSAYVDSWDRDKVFPTPPVDFGVPSLDLSNINNLYFFKEDYIESGASGVAYGDTSQCILYEDYCPGPENPGVQFTALDGTYEWPETEPFVVLFERDVTGAGNHTVIRKIEKSLASPENLCVALPEPQACPNMPGFTYVLDEVFDSEGQIVEDAAYALDLDLCLLVCPNPFITADKYNPVDNAVYRLNWQSVWVLDSDLEYDPVLNQCVSDVCVDVVGLQFENSGSYPGTASDHPTDPAANADGSTDTYFVGPEYQSCYSPICTNAVELGLTGENSVVWWDNPFPEPGPAYENPDYPDDYFPLDPYWDGCDAVIDGNCDYSEWDLSWELENGYNPVYHPACNPLTEGNCDYAGSEPNDGVVYARDFTNAPYELNGDGTCSGPPNPDLCTNISGEQVVDDFLSGGSMYGVVQNGDGTCNACANFANNVTEVPAGYEASIINDVQFCDFCGGAGNMIGIQQEYSLGIRTHDDPPVFPYVYSNDNYTHDENYVKQPDGMCVYDVCLNLDPPIQPDPTLIPDGYFDAGDDGVCELNACPLNVPELLLYENGGILLDINNVPDTEGYIIDTDGICKIDVCTNLGPAQGQTDMEVIPDGYSDDDGDGICTLVDLCDNISGNQTSIPLGYLESGGMCDYCHGGNGLADVSGAQVNGINDPALLNGRVYTTITGTNTVTDLDPNTCTEFACSNLWADATQESFIWTGTEILFNGASTDLDYNSGSNTCSCDPSGDQSVAGCPWECNVGNGYLWNPEGGGSCSVNCVVTDGSAPNFPLTPAQNAFGPGAVITYDLIDYTLGGAADSGSRTCTPTSNPVSVVFETTKGFINVNDTCEITLETTGVGFCRITLNNEDNSAVLDAGASCTTGDGSPGSPCFLDATGSGGLLDELLELTMERDKGSVLVTAECGVVDGSLVETVLVTEDDECRITPNIGEF